MLVLWHAAFTACQVPAKAIKAFNQPLLRSTYPTGTITTKGLSFQERLEKLRSIVIVISKEVVLSLFQMGQYVSIDWVRYSTFVLLLTSGSGLPPPPCISYSPNLRRFEGDCDGCFRGLPIGVWVGLGVRSTSFSRPRRVLVLTKTFSFTRALGATFSLRISSSAGQRTQVKGWKSPDRLSKPS